MKPSKNEGVNKTVQRAREESKLRGSKECKAAAMLPLLAAYFDEDVEQMQKCYEVTLWYYIGMNCLSVA